MRSAFPNHMPPPAAWPFLLCRQSDWYWLTGPAIVSNEEWPADKGVPMSDPVVHFDAADPHEKPLHATHVGLRPGS